MPLSACVCPYAYAYALVKTRLKGAFQKSELEGRMGHFENKIFVFTRNFP